MLKHWIYTLLSIVFVLFLFGFIGCHGQTQQNRRIADEGSEVGEDIHGCPPRCICFKTTVRCMFMNFDTVPDVPEDTTILDLRFNRIKEIKPTSFKQLKNLNTLLLNNNNLSRLESYAFDRLPQLKYLYLYKNQISEIDAMSFRGLDKLEQLDVKFHNRERHISNVSLKTNQQFYIHYNELETIQPGTFDGLPALERLFLHNNKIKRLPEGILSSLTALRRLRLDSNALICDCHVMWLSEMLKDGHMQAAVTCGYPTHLAGKSLLSISDNLKCRKPELTTRPHDVEVSFGSTASFSCRAEGDPQPEIIWYHNSEEISSNRLDGGSRYSILDNGTLTIRNTQASDKGSYECVARNPMGEAKASPVELRQFDDSLPTRPRILAKPEDQTLGEGAAASLECLTSGYPRPEVAWTKNDQPLPQDPRFRVGVSGTLLITDVRISDQGVYRCTVFNNIGKVSEYARIEVFAAPQFMKRPDDQKIVEGHPVFFSCDINSDPPAKISWKKDGRDISRDDPRITINPSGTTLTIGDVRTFDAGAYECTAESVGGRKSASGQLTVVPRVPPTILKIPVDVHSPIGSQAQFDCVADGNPTPIIKWQRDNIPVQLTTSHKHQVTSAGSLIIHEVSHIDEGVYECIAENVAGVVQASAQLTVWDARYNVITNQHINRTVAETTRQINNAIDNTQRELQDIRNHPRNPNDLLRLFRYPPTSALSITRAAEIFEQTLEKLFADVHRGAQYNISYTNNETYQELLSPTQMALVSSLSGCREHRRIVVCEDMCFHKKYRTFDGTCNNFRNPMQSASLSPLIRLQPPRYENNFNLPVGWDSRKLYEGQPLPSARTVSLRIISTKRVTPDDQYTHMLMQWGQFLDHDLDFVPTAVSNARFSDGRFCNETCNNQSPCFAIPVSEDDPRVRRYRCIGFVRSSAMCGSGLTSVFFNNVIHREQLNLLTSYIDASNVYGSSDEDARNLRDFTTNRGMLRVGLQSITAPGKYNLPANQGEFVDCQVDPNNAHIPCFQAGDHRANEQLGLISMHTIWFREHNRIATELLTLNPHWDGDIIYHETRKIVGAMMQHITYQHWLPKIFGPVGMRLLGSYQGYDPNVDASIANEFAAAAFRFGHTLINPVLSRLNESFQPIPEGNLPLHKAFFAPFRIVEEGGIDPVLRGLFGVAAKRLRPGEFLNTELTEHLFTLANEVAQDLAAFNLQRGRDHGLQNYNTYRKHCGLKVATTFDDFQNEIRNADVRKKLKEVYGHPNNVELFIGGIAEDTLEGGRIGPTFTCIIADQFKRLRDGDRFWYENPDVFTPAQLTEIKQATLARVICDNSDGIEEVQQDVFQLASYPDGYLRCDSPEISRMDLTVWSHCCQECSRSGDFRSITRHFRNRRSTEHSYKDSADVEPILNDEEDKPDLGEMGPEDVMNHIAHMSQNMMDVVDLRIEGMEEMMRELQQTVQKLNKKIGKLEKTLPKAKKHPLACLDNKGKSKQEGDRWKENDCRTCVCKSSQLECMTETCQIPSCKNPVKIPGQCCPSCP